MSVLDTGIVDFLAQSPAPSNARMLTCIFPTTHKKTGKIGHVTHQVPITPDDILRNRPLKEIVLRAEHCCQDDEYVSTQQLGS